MISFQKVLLAQRQREVAGFQCDAAPLGDIGMEEEFSSSDYDSDELHSSAYGDNTSHDDTFSEDQGEVFLFRVMFIVWSSTLQILTDEDVEAKSGESDSDISELCTDMPPLTGSEDEGTIAGTLCLLYMLVCGGGYYSPPGAL